ncbi:hypothetical protein A3A93_06560 [Candidatus Roizmanbacteria bacterium RIFCSPLOWO2_01_FULL_38_12]|uniref:Uncharacterized protein n=1 Tax=Candidatus Roizmanbacteria bacterium RIFCSPLOWO2_01_FULL_38_12 TaxID=1802061 RepID=A0A1F7ISC4_9BACT|nr:MAG: hypothetical protein A3A93_06560 [Candidatus Roizmanbacteria bacterium RIFCSPLOWO2_01_FULL_38_12]
MANQPGGPPEQTAQATLTPEQFAMLMQQQMAGQGRRVEQQAPRGDPKAEGTALVEQVEQQILLSDYNGRRKDQLQLVEPAEFKGKVQRELTPKLKRRIQDQTSNSKKVREHLEVTGGSFNPGLDQGEARNVSHDVTVAVSMVATALEEGYVTPPTHEPTLAVLNSLARKLRRHVKPETASYLQPLLDGILNETDYIKFSTGDDLTTKFERDLKDILTAREGDDVVVEILNDIFTEVIDQNKIPQMTMNRYRMKIERAKTNRKADTKILKERAEQLQKDILLQQKEFSMYDLEGPVLAQLRVQEQSGVAEAGPARRLFESLDSAENFFKFYETEFREQVRRLLENDGVIQKGQELGDLVQLEQHNKEIFEEAAKKTTEEIHKLVIYTTHVIFTPVLEGNPGQSWQELIAEATRGFIPLDQIFNNYKGKFIRFMGQTSALPGEFEKKGMPFFNFGIEERDVYVENKQEGKMVRDKVPTSELVKVDSFKEYIEKMHVVLDAEKGYLESGVNVNYLLLTGKTQGDATFFGQFARYIEQSLKSSYIDEIYHLPYADLIHAAKIQLSSFFKKQLALNQWIKDPDIFLTAFTHANKIQSKALFDLIRNFAPEAPEWAVRRAFFHARTHMSAISQEWHALSGYGHPNLTEDFKPSYTDPAMKNLETYNTMYSAQQWQVADPEIQNMAFLPQPNKKKRFDKWYWKDAVDEGRDMFRNMKHLGSMTGVGMEYYDAGTAPNIFEFNPLKIGGVEQQGGYRIKYPVMPWMFDMLKHLSRDNEHIKMDSPGALTEAWKRLENLGVDVLKHTFRDHWMLGYEEKEKKGTKHLKQKDDGTTEYDAQWKNFFGFLYERYFKQGIGKEGFSMDFNDQNLQERKVDFSTIHTKEEFWDQLVEPILHRKTVAGMGETKSDATSRNNREREKYIKEIVTHALTVMTFERMPMDFVFIENPTRSQNGVTLLRQLQKDFLKKARDAGKQVDIEKDIDANAELMQEFEAVVNDILFVQQQARMVSIRKMNEFVKEQKHNQQAGEGMQARQKNVYARDMNRLRSELYSDVQLIDNNNDVKGYRITEEVVRHFLTEKYRRQYMRDEHVADFNNLSQPAKDNIANNVTKAVEMFSKTQELIVKQPEENQFLKPSVSNKDLETLLGKERVSRDMERLGIKNEEKYLTLMRNTFQEQQNNLKKRAMWSEEELLSGQTGMGINDMAYPFLSFSSVGADMVQRTIEQIRDTQEEVFNYVNGVKGASLVSDLKKYYRKEDQEKFFDNVSHIRTQIKIWLDPERYNGQAMRFVENAMNVMRINSEAEDRVVELGYITAHKMRSAFSAVVKEGPEYPLRREDRYAFIEEFLHEAQFGKRASPDDQVYVVEKPKSVTELWQESGPIISKIAAITGQLFGEKKAKYVRQVWKEQSGIGLRSREYATITDLVMRYGPTYLVLIFAALILLLIRKGAEDSGI